MWLTIKAIPHDITSSSSDSRLSQASLWREGCFLVYRVILFFLPYPVWFCVSSPVLFSTTPFTTSFLENQTCSSYPNECFLIDLLTRLVFCTKHMPISREDALVGCLKPYLSLKRINHSPILLSNLDVFLVEESIFLLFAEQYCNLYMQLCLTPVANAQPIT